MRKLLSALILCVVFMFSVTPLTAYAISPIDPLKDSSLTLHYEHNQSAYEGLTVRSYRIAEVFPNGTYELTGAFKKYPVSIYGITSQTEWKTIASTLEAYVSADKIEPTVSAVTDENGTVSFTKILPGMYLTTLIRVERENDITIFESFLSVVPYPDDDGNHNYDVVAYPKCHSFTPTPEEKEHKVVKQWKDNGYTEKRPEYVTVDIYKDGVLSTTQKLSAQNNWSYHWTAPNDGSEWKAVEREIPADYTVTVVENGNTVIITNVYNYDPGPPPETGDTSVMWPYVLSMCISGGIITVLATWLKRKES